MIPCGTKADEEAATGLEHGIHRLKDGAGLCKMFERVEGNDDFYGIGD